MLPMQLKDSQRHQRQPKQVELFLQSMYDGHWAGMEGVGIVTFSRKELIESGFPGVGIMGSHQQVSQLYPRTRGVDWSSRNMKRLRVIDLPDGNLTGSSREWVIKDGEMVPSISFKQIDGIGVSGSEC